MPPCWSVPRLLPTRSLPEGCDRLRVEVVEPDLGDQRTVEPSEMQGQIVEWFPPRTFRGDPEVQGGVGIADEGVEQLELLAPSSMNGVTTVVTSIRGTVDGRVDVACFVECQSENSILRDEVVVNDAVVGVEAFAAVAFACLSRR